MRSLARLVSLVSFALVFLLFSVAARAVVHQVTVEGLSAGGFVVALDVIEGGPPSNSVTISNFSTDGTLSTEVVSGGASGRG